MHQLIMSNEVPYILPFLIINQPSRPYFNNSTFDYNMSKESLSKKDDRNKVKEIFGERHRDRDLSAGEQPPL